MDILCPCVVVLEIAWTSYVEWRDSALLSMEVEIVGRDVLKVRFYLKWRDSALLSMEVEAVGRRRARRYVFI